MIAWLWLKRSFAANGWRNAGAAAGVALAAGLLGELGSFLSASSAAMTTRAAASLPVDWQAQLIPGGDASAVGSAIRAATPVDAMQIVSYADVSGFSAAENGTVQTTGSGQVVGLPPSYANDFPDQLRFLVGAKSGILLAQQTAANLHAHVGERISILRTAAPPVSAIVAGIVDLPFADSFFQAIGPASGVAPPAPPDDVLFVPASVWLRWFGSQAQRLPQSVRLQWHVRIARNLPRDPQTALSDVTARARNAELRAAGAAAIADNLAAQLFGTREDALYARVLFLFLGLPGALVAVVLGVAVVSSSSERRRRDAALLRIRGASLPTIVRLAAIEACAVAAGGAAVGFALSLAGARLFASDGIQAQTSVVWAALAALAAAIVVIGAYTLPLASAGASSTEMRQLGIVVTAAWRRFALDFVLIAVGAIFFWKTAASGYQVVLAPEGVIQASVSYDAFVGPMCVWLGATLLTRRVSDAILARRGAVIARALAPAAGPLAGVAAAALARQSKIIGRGATFIALAISFAVATAIFNTTYAAQARVDAELTNGADVTVSMPPGADTDRIIERLRRLPGVRAVATMHHAFAYVGQDLQDLYAIDPASIGSATNISDAFFAGGHAQRVLDRLSAQRDGALVSEETVNDFRLRQGDRINLRLQVARGNQYRAVPFTFAGVVREFPTAPRDSFIVTNEQYFAAATGNAGSNVALLRVAGSTRAVAQSARRALAGIPGVRVSDISEVVHSVGSTLTAIDVRGLTTIELTFAWALAIGASGLTLALGFAERRRNFAILSALGATPRQLATFLWAEGSFVFVVGCFLGVVIGFVVATMLVKVLTGVFDPPPTALSIPWAYLVSLIVFTAAASGLAVLAASRLAQRDPAGMLRT